jgi:hypothetical protein
MIVSKRKLKELEFEAFKVKSINIKAEVKDAVCLQLKKPNNRIEVLEAIITDKQYALNESITHFY